MTRPWLPTHCCCCTRSGVAGPSPRRSGEPEGPLRADRAEQPFQRHLDVLPPGHGRFQLQPQPRVVQVRADRLEAHREQVVRGQHAGQPLGTQVTERLDGLHPAPGQILGDPLDQHPAQAAAGELAQDAGRHQQHRVRADRARREGQRARHVHRRRVQHVAGRRPVHVGDLPATAPFEQRRGDPGFLFQRGVAHLFGPGMTHRVEFPEDTPAAPLGQIIQIVQGDTDKTARHGHPWGYFWRQPALPTCSLTVARQWARTLTWYPPTPGAAVSSEQCHPAPARVDPYLDHCAARARGMVASEIRALFAVAARPEVVSLAGGMPYISALPLDAVGEMAGQLVADRGAVALQYGSGQGDPGLREGICEVMSLEGIRAHPDEVVVTVGSQQALDLITRIFVDPGDVVLAEGPSYVGALGTFSSYQARVVHVPIDDDGLIPGALASVLAQLATAGRRAKFLYTCPSFHNPAGVSLSGPRRGEILGLCQRAGLPVVEDNPYGLLGFDGEPPRALRADDPQVIYLGTFSKTIAPGLRVGWAVAPAGVRDKLVLAAESAVLCHSSFAQLLVREYLASQPWREQVKVLRELYRERRDAMLDSLRASLPAGCRWTSPGGGFYVWLGLPPGLDAKAMLPRAIAARVAYVPGTGFYADGAGADHLRLSYCFPEPDRIREGVRRLAGVIDAELELRATFGAP